MEQYSNVMKALQGMQSPATASAPGLTYEQQSDNYNTFSELMKKGVYLPDLIKRMDELEAKVKTLEAQPKHDANAELLAVMEASVKSDPEVREARQKVADIKTSIISEMCLKDPRYAQAVEDYKTTVNRVYIRSRESDGRAQIQAEDGAGAPQICDDSGGSQAHQESLSAGETDATDEGNRLRSLNIGFRLYTPKNSIILIRGPLTRMR